MRPACLSGPVPGLRRSPGPPLSARGAEAAAREGHARLRESQAPRRSLAAPARLAPACERHGGLDVLLIKLEARRSGLVGKRRTGRGALELAPSRRGPSCGRPLRTPNPWEPPSLRPSMWGDAASPLGPQGAIRWEAQGGKNPPMGSGHHRSSPPGSAPATRRPQAGCRAGGRGAGPQPRGGRGAGPPCRVHCVVAGGVSGSWASQSPEARRGMGVAGGPPQRPQARRSPSQAALDQAVPVYPASCPPWALKAERAATVHSSQHLPRTRALTPCLSPLHPTSSFRLVAAPWMAPQARPLRSPP